MARAGQCAECGTSVWLTEDGCCPSGHSATSITGIYEAATPGATDSTAPVRHEVPKCNSCGWVGPWKVESLLLPHHWVIGLLFVVVGGVGVIYLGAVAIARSNQSRRAKICPNCGAKNMHTFMY